MKIHPTAIVSPKARIGENVVIGPLCIIGKDVSIGAGTVIEAQAVIDGATTIGEGNTIGRGAIIGTQPQDHAFDEFVHSEVRIGQGNRIQEFVTIHRGTQEGSATIVEDHCLLMTGCHLGHNVHLGSHVTVHNNCLLGGYVDVGDGAELGVGSVYHQFLRVGTLSMVRESTRSVKDVPPYLCVSGFSTLRGLNSIGLRRAGWSIDARKELRRAFRLIYQSQLNMSQALSKAGETSWSPEALGFFEFIRSSKRGVCSKMTSHAHRLIRADDW